MADNTPRTSSIQIGRIIEALIFSSAEPVSTRTLEKHLPEGVVLDDIMKGIAGRYGEDSGIELRQIGTAWAFRTRADIASLLMIEKVAERTLSRAALETMAIIAYHQPITRAEIEEIRGISLSKGTIDILLELTWIKPRGRRRTPGRPLTWGTSPSFLDYFGTRQRQQQINRSLKSLKIDKKRQLLGIAAADISLETVIIWVCHWLR